MEIKYRNNSITTNKNIKKTAYYTIGSFSFLCIFVFMKGFYIFCDESLKKGKYYSNFYGGLLIDKKDFERLIMYY